MRGECLFGHAQLEVTFSRFVHDHLYTGFTVTDFAQFHRNKILARSSPHARFE